ncbi:MAG TPA: tRNA-dihydrouridine synthase [Candidatus Woesebacteria bacterium]|nr:tRNA-dihydrouridine synthase [Candidatus Woesebacteria bacterium]HPJ16898.1 tRNA-dihydrouridine synthase [Candidatus Woesebacteria bacterium]
MNWLDQKKTFIGLSPMDGITDEAFRLTQIQVARPDVIFTEFVSAEGLAHHAVKLYSHFWFEDQERPIIAQLFGKDPESFYIASQIVLHLGFDGVDINMGCPAKTVTQHGSGASLIDKPDLAKEIILAVKRGVADYSSAKNLNHLHLPPKVTTALLPLAKKAVSHPTISLKTRLGVLSPKLDWISFLSQFNLDLITLHGRTLKQGYSGQADWQLINQAKEIIKNNCASKFFGNGDLNSLKQAQEYLDQYGLDGVLIGRAAMGNPWVFSDHQPTWLEKFNALIYHTEQFQRLYPNSRLDPLRRHYLLYTHSHPKAKELRQKLVTLTTIDQLLALEPEFLNC